MKIIKKVLYSFFGLIAILLIFFGLLRPFFGGLFYARSAPVFESLMCADFPFNYYPHGDFTMYLSWACKKSVYWFRGSPSDIAEINSDLKGIMNIVIDTEDTENRKKMLEFWLNKGLNINTQDQFGNSILFYSDKVETISFLLEHGARKDIVNNKGLTPAQSVIEYQEKHKIKINDYEKIVQLLQ